MAIIKCPECGGTVSTTVDKCIHCGTELKVCPECQTAVIGDAEYCPGCGAAFKTCGQSQEKDEKEKTVENEIKQLPLDDIMKKVNKPAFYYIFKYLNVIILVFSCAIWGLHFFNSCNAWFSGNTSDNTSFILSFVVFMVLQAVRLFFSDLEDLFLINGIKSWSKSHNIDLLSVIEGAIYENFGKMNSYVAVKHKEKISYLAYAYSTDTSSISYMGKLVASISGSFFMVVEAIVGLIGYFILAAILQITGIDSSLLFAVIFLVLSLLYMAIFAPIDKRFKSKVDEHVQKVVSPDAYVKYSIIGK